MHTANIYKISRPRFWLYTAGPFLIGTAAAAQSISDVHSGWVLLFLVYFLFPANLFIYGINDTYDYETDKLNPKKQQYELLVTPSMHDSLLKWIIYTNLPFWIIAFGLPIKNIFAMLAFLLFSLFYSAPPIRAKTKPLLDSIFNILYLFPGWFAYYLGGGTAFNWKIFFAGMLWVMAMHAFSAIPDIASDAKVGLQTIATKLGRMGTLMFCALCYIGAALLSLQYVHWLSIVLGSCYVLMILLAAWGKNNTRIFRVYTWFPVVNGILGFSIFCYIVYPLFKF